MPAATRGDGPGILNRELHPTLNFPPLPQPRPPQLQYDPSQYNNLGPRDPVLPNWINNPGGELDAASHILQSGLFGSRGIPPILGLQGRPPPTLGRQK